MPSAVVSPAANTSTGIAVCFGDASWLRVNLARGEVCKGICAGPARVGDRGFLCADEGHHHRTPSAEICRACEGIHLVLQHILHEHAM